MTDLRKAAEMALETLCVGANDAVPNDIDERFEQAIQALRQALAQPEQECTCSAKDMPFGKCCKTHLEHGPVARVDYNRKGNIAWLYGPVEPDGTLLYTAPPKRGWQGLTDEERIEANDECDGWLHMALIIEAKLKEKNT